MSKEIKELENKYLVLKWDDIGKYLSLGSQKEVLRISDIIRKYRTQEGKNDNSYLVLNLDDEINIKDMFARLLDRTNFDVEAFTDIGNRKVKDIAVDLVNAILKAKEKE